MSPNPRASGNSVLQVFIFRDGRFWGTECFAQPAVVVGRSPESDLQLDDDITSRTHAQFSVTPEGVVLEDLGSSNGTLVNGEPVTRCLIESRDEVSIGSFTLKVKLLSKTRPVRQFREETRLVDRAAMKDALTEVVQPQPVEDEMLVDEQAREAEIQPEPVPARVAPVREVADDRRREIAGALREELERIADDFETVSTERLKSGAAVRAASAPAKRADEFDAETQVEPAPLPAQPAVQDLSTRWLTPPPEAEQPLALDVESVKTQAERPARQPQPAEPAPLADWSLPSTAAPKSEPKEAFLPPALEMPEPAPSLVSVGTTPEEEDSDEEEVPEGFVEPFSLLNNLIRENFAEPQVPTEAKEVVEVIGYAPREKNVQFYDQVVQGRKYRVGLEKFVLVRYDQPASCTVMFGEDFSGGLIAGGQTVSLDDLKTSANLVATKKGKRFYRYRLQKGDYGNLIREDGGWFLRFVNPPRLPPPRRGLTLNPLMLKIFGSSFLAHIIFIVILSFFSKSVEAVSDADIDRFAKVAMTEIQTEIVEKEAEVPLDALPKPEEQKIEETKEEKKPEEKAPEEKAPKQKPTKASKKPGKGGGGEGGGGGGGVGMMAALGNINKTGPSTNIVAAVSNLDAVRVPGAQSRYKVSGIVTKLPTSSVVLSRGGGVGVKAGIDLLRGGKGQGGVAGIGPGALGGGLTGSRKVGGVVFQAPKRRMVVQGQLSREAIAEVVRQHLREIQYCYEKNLLLTPNLQGKVVMEWTISTSGSVSIVKTAQNTMATPAVAMCIAANIKGWKFPQPKGGVVVVSYPFIFNTVGF